MGKAKARRKRRRGDGRAQKPAQKTRKSVPGRRACPGEMAGPKFAWLAPSGQRIESAAFLATLCTPFRRNCPSGACFLALLMFVSADGSLLVWATRARRMTTPPSSVVQIKSSSVSRSEWQLSSLGWGRKIKWQGKRRKKQLLSGWGHSRPGIPHSPCLPSFCPTRYDRNERWHLFVSTSSFVISTGG